MAMYGALHPSSDADRLYLSRKEGRRDPIGAEECVRGEVNSLSWYLKCSMGKLMEAVRIASTLETGNAVEQRAFKSARKEEAKRKWHERKMCGQFVREKGERVQHIVSELKKLSQHEYKKRL